MPFKDMIPWRRGRHEVPVQRAEQRGSNSLEPRNDFDLAPLFRETESLFERFFAGFGGGLVPSDFFRSGTGPAGPSLQLDVTETDDAYHVAVELPGVDEKDVEVTLANGALAIRGEKRAESRDEKGEVFRMERSYGRFERTVALPSEIDEERVRASFRRGVLEVTLPKSERARQRARRIQVHAGD